MYMHYGYMGDYCRIYLFAVVSICLNLILFEAQVKKICNTLSIIS